MVSKPIEVTNFAFRSRWGWHSLNYESYLLLKKLHKIVWEGWRKHCKLMKWCSLTVNRSKIPPNIDNRITVIATDTPELIPMPHRHKINSGIYNETLVTSDFKSVDDDFWYSLNIRAYLIVKAMWDARKPAPSPAEVYPPLLNSESLKIIANDWGVVIENKKLI
jgi:hypothetical protein